MPKYQRVRTVRRSDALAGVDLCKRRCWFAEDDSGQGGDPPNDNGRDAHDEDPGRDAQDSKTSDELAKLRQQVENLQTRLSEVNSEAARRRKEKENALKDAGNWEQLAKEREAEIARLEGELELVKPRLDTLTESIKERNTGRIAKIPEKNRSLVPTDYEPEALATWLDANWGILTARPAPEIDAGAGGSGGGKGKAPPTLTSEEQETADAFGMTPEEYAKFRDTQES
jgi:hypothetical protein